MRLKIFCIFLLTAFVCFKAYDRQQAQSLEPMILDQTVRNVASDADADQQLLEDASRQLQNPKHN